MNDAVAATGDTVETLVETAHEAVKDLTKEAEETADGATKVPAEIVDAVAFATVDALNAATERIEKLEGLIGRGAEKVIDAPEEVVKEVTEPVEVPNAATRHGHWLSHLR